MNEFKDVCKGAPAKLAGCKFLYRISNVHWVITDSNCGAGLRTKTASEKWSKVKDDQDNPEQWLELAKYVRGPLPGRRDFTWWTPLELISPPVLPNVHRIGVVNDWLATQVFLLRWPLQGYNSSPIGNIPTVIDGFDSLIFQAMDERACETGFAIDVRNPGQLRSGAPEVVVRHVNSVEVEFLPIELTHKDRMRFNVEQEAVIGPLIDYYSGGSEVND